MISTISRYLSALFLARFGFLLFGLSILVVFLDFMADGDEVLEAGDGTASPILFYTLLRLPEILSELIPITAMLAGFLTFAGLARHHELTAMLGIGVSKFKLALAILPAGVLVALMQFAIEDQALPVAVDELRAWGVADYAAKNDAGPVWIRQGTDIARIGRLDHAADRLEDVTIFRRDADGNLLERIEAEAAVYGDDTWSLQGVRRTEPGEGAEIETAPLDWPQGLSPKLMRAAASHPKETPLLELLTVSAQSDLGTQPRYRYQVWLQERIAGPVTTVILIIMTVGLAQPFERRGGPGFLLAVWLATGFVCWTFDGLVLTFGEIGLLPPALAAWTAPVVFLAVALSLMLNDERRKVEPHAPAPAHG